MMKFQKVSKQLIKDPKTWLITGVAGFIGSNLLERLLKLGQNVVGLDNFITGNWQNLDDVKGEIGEEAWSGFTFIEGDICDLDDCRMACDDVDYVLHQAALGSVPSSIDDPIYSNSVNVDGFVNMLVAAGDAKVKRFVYASSCAVYGDNQDLPLMEDAECRPMSPYAATKLANEVYANSFSRTYGSECIGLRYFNVFGPRQDPGGAYAAVIPRWIEDLLEGKAPVINGDGEISRDFCYIDYVVQANILSALTENEEALNQVYNIASGRRTTLNELFDTIKVLLIVHDGKIKDIFPEIGPSRKGDIRDSQADIGKARSRLGYDSAYDVKKGMKETVRWFVENRGTLRT